ncbi:uncharacterized protein N7529_006976 [Penicillium soppii]|uniref:uncharacterized protein n=1 Tax=Penicillium soppii TaxID=69789 RepID=UPI0025496D47|nr:uncharacterized protein N7529_006976 [Penicillium soppii]KAJ5865060.1 hypothetical protein N7529_006976 [Penicillium soppii]
MGKVKWDSTADQTLLAKILETHELSVDSHAVAAAWPGADDSKPTPRAIKERITKIKDIIKKGAPDAAGTNSPVTPKKVTPRKKAADGAANDTPTKKRKTLTKAKTVSTTAGPVKEDPVPKIKREITEEEDEELFNYPISATREESTDTEDEGLFDSPIAKEEPFDDTAGEKDPGLCNHPDDLTLSQDPADYGL